MKKLILKIFFFLCSFVFFYQGAAFMMVYFGKIPLDNVMTTYRLVLQTQDWLNFLLGVAIAFIGAGFVFTHLVLRRKRHSNDIVVNNKGEMVRIPVNTIKNFINQVIAQNSNFHDVKMTIYKKARWIIVDICCAVTTDLPVHEAIGQIKEVLKEEIRKVFEFPNLKINFQVEGIVAGNNAENIVPESKKENRLEDEITEIEQPSEVTEESRLQDDIAPQMINSVTGDEIETRKEGVLAQTFRLFGQGRREAQEKITKRPIVEHDDSVALDTKLDPVESRSEKKSSKAPWEI